MYYIPYNTSKIGHITTEHNITLKLTMYSNIILYPNNLQKLTPPWQL